MITQSLLNWLADFIARAITLIPPLPDVWANSLAYIETAGAYLGPLVSNTGVLIPWSTFGAALAIWAAVVAFWALMLALRVVLWVLK